MQGTWTLQKINGTTDVPAHPQVEFTVDGINYRYGNNFFAMLKIDGNNIEFGPLCGTKMYCPQEPAENLLTKAFESSTQFKVQGNNLTLLGADGQTLVELTK